MASNMGSRNSSGHSRHSDSGSNRDTAGSSSTSFNTSPPVEQGTEVVPKPRNYLSTSHAGVMRGSSDTAELALSQHAREDLEVVPEAAGHLERSSFNQSGTSLRAESLRGGVFDNMFNQSSGSFTAPSANAPAAMTNNVRPPENLRRIPYDDFVSHYSEEFIMDTSDRMEGSLRMDGSMSMRMAGSLDRSERQNERSERMERTEKILDRSERSERCEGRRGDNSGELSRQDSVSRGPSSMSVVSDVSYGDKPYHSMPVISLAQDSGSILPHLNTSHKSACSMTPGSKRMAEKRAALIRSGSIIYNDDTHDRKRKEDMDLEFTRWGGRKDYQQKENDRKRKLALHRIHKRKVRAEKRKSMEEEESFRLAEPKGHGFHDLWGFSIRQDVLQYQQLIKEDKDRELVASFCEEPFWKIIFHFKGTVLRVIIEDILFWLTLATYCSIRIKFRLEPDEEQLEVNYENLSQNLVYVGGFLLFFLVFYVNQNHHRYFNLHQDSMALMGRVNDMATLVKAVLPMERARRINRFMNAAHVAMYTGLSSTYEKENFFDPLEQRFALLTDEELYRIIEEIDVDNSGPKAAFEIVTWIMCDIRDSQINSFIDTNEAMQLRELLLDFRSTIAKVFVTTTLPIPFFYVHFLSMLTAVYLPLFAVVIAFETGPVMIDSNSTWVAETVSGLVVFLQALFVIGLRILGQQLSDPFGGDLIDLQIARYVNMILNGSNQILAAKRLHPPSIETELRLQLKMSSLGQAFEYDTDDEVVVQH